MKEDNANDYINFSLRDCLFCNKRAVYYSGHIHNDLYGLVTVGVCKDHHDDIYREIRLPNFDCELNGDGCYGTKDGKIAVIAENFRNNYFVYFDENGNCEKIEEY